MNPTADNDKQTAAVRGVVTAFLFMGTLLQAFALPAMVVGAFAGPHLLIPAVAMLAVGVAFLALSRGIARGSRPANIAGAVLAAVVATASVCWATALSLQAGEPWPVRFFLGLMALALGAPFAVAVVTLVNTCPANHATPHE